MQALGFQLHDGLDLKLGAVVGQEVLGSGHSLVADQVHKVGSSAVRPDVDFSGYALASQLGLNGTEPRCFAGGHLAGYDLNLHGVTSLWW